RRYRWRLNRVGPRRTRARLPNGELADGEPANWLSETHRADRASRSSSRRGNRRAAQGYRHIDRELRMESTARYPGWNRGHGNDRLRGRARIENLRSGGRSRLSSDAPRGRTGPDQV